MKRIYLDYAATTPVDPEVVKAMTPYFTESFGNPSAVYACAQENRAAVEAARKQIARAIGAQTEEIIFTSGGTEGDNMAIKGVAWANQKRGNHIITTVIEHHAVHESCRFLSQQGFDITYLPVDEYGLVDPQAVKRAITPKTILISVMHANNEIGTIQPIAEIGQIAREAGVYLHTDAVQTLGHIPVNVEELKVDLLAVSAHKLYGPKGVGFIYARQGTRLTPFMHGGGQERGRRAGTENVPGIVGLGKAVELATNDLGQEIERQSRLRDGFINTLAAQITGLQLNGHLTKRLPNNINLSVDYVEGEAVLMYLDLQGICASTGSACNSTANEPSHVLTALGISPVQAHCSLRFTLGKWTTEADIAQVLRVLPPVIARLREMSPLAPTG
jgi:cysteine desulfurase